MGIRKKRAATVLAATVTAALVGAGLAIAATQPSTWERVWACVHEDGRLAYFQFRDTADANCGDGPGGLQRWSWTVGGQQPAIQQKVYTASDAGRPTSENQTVTTAQLDLPAGTYQVTVDGSFIAGAALGRDTVVRPQLALFYDENGNGELDQSSDEFRIGPNTVLPPVAGRHMTVSGSTVLRVDGLHKLGVAAFAQADDRQTTTGDQIRLQYATVTATPVLP